MELKGAHQEPDRRRAIESKAHLNPVAGLGHLPLADFYLHVAIIALATTIGLAVASMESLTPILLLVMLLLFLYPLAPGKKPIDLFEPVNIFSFLYFLAFWLRPLQTYLDFDDTILPYARMAGAAPAGLTTGLALALGGLAAFYIGYYSRVGPFLSGFSPRLRGEWIGARVRIVISTLMVITVMLWANFLMRAGYTIGDIFRPRLVWLLQDTDLALAMRISAFLLATITYGHLVGRSRGILQKRFAIVVPLLVGFLFVAFGYRDIILLTVFAPFIIWHYCVRRLKRWGIVLLLVASISYVLLAGGLRGGVAASEIITGEIGGIVSAQLGASSSVWDNLLVVLQQFRTGRDRYGWSIVLETLLFLVPRRLWLEKPRIYGEYRVQLDALPGLIDPETGIGHYESLGPLGLGYSIFGLAGSLLAMFLHGIFLRACYGVFKRNEVSLGAAIFLAFTVAHTYHFVRGFVTAYLIFMVGAVPVLLVLRYLCGGGERGVGMGFTMLRFG